MKYSTMCSITLAAASAMANPFRRAAYIDVCREGNFQLPPSAYNCPTVKTDVCLMSNQYSCPRWGPPDVAAILSDVAKAKDPAKALFNGVEPNSNDPYNLKSLSQINYSPEYLEPLVHADCAAKLDKLVKRVGSQSFGYTREDLAALHKVGCVFWYSPIRATKREMF